MPLTPNNREEHWLQGMVDGETTLTPNNRKEHWYQAIIDGSTDLEPNKRSEYWYKEIMESKGGGGGSSDFSIAQVTVTNNVGYELSMSAPCAFNANEAWDESPACSYSSVFLETGDTTLSIIMYKGKAFIDNSFGKNTVVVTGGIELVYDDFMFQVTGDGTITIS